MTSSEIEDFPDCKGCLRFINNECADERAHLKDDCYQQRESFINPKFERWWVKNLRSPN